MQQSEWTIRDCGMDEHTLLKNESVFALTNGHLGVRGNFEEGSAGLKTIRGAYLNGCYDTLDVSYDEKFTGFPEYKQTIVNLPDFQTIHLWADDEAFSLFSGSVMRFDRVLDMKNGIYRRQIIWRSPKGRELCIEIIRMVSLTVKDLFAIDYRVKPLNFDGQIRFESKCCADVENYSDSGDPRISSHREKNIRFISGDVQDGIIRMDAKTVHSGIGIHIVISHDFPEGCTIGGGLCGQTANVTAAVDAKQNAQVRLVKYVRCADSLHHDNTHDVIDAARIDALYASQRAYLDARWHIADVKVDADDDTDTSLRYCIFQLICHNALNTDSIPAKGLTGEGYAGHYFWDAEIFIHPFYTLTDPAAARRLLLFRYRTLDAARENARLLGHEKGAAYPWRTISGSECSSFFPGGGAQYHINADIVYALIGYYLATGDEAFLLNEGAEIVWETARLWMQLGHFQQGRFHIDTVTGPDEYTCLINNNYYTNLMAQYNLKWAVRIYDTLMRQNDTDLIHRIGLLPEEVSNFKIAAENMYLPSENEHGITPQDDSFLSKKMWDLDATPEDMYPLLLHYHPMTLYRYQVCKQADVLLAYYLFQKRHDPNQMRRSYQFYEKITTHDSSLSPCIFSIMAARLGMTQKAFSYFGRTIKLDIEDSHSNTKDGLHMANLGGSYLCVVGGFAGLVIDEDGASISPVMPPGWRSYSFRFIYRGSVFEVIVTADKTVIKRLSGEPQSLSLNGVLMCC